MRITCVALLLLIRWSGSVSPAGEDYPALEALDAAAVCAAIAASAGVETNPMGAAWQPGSNQTAGCWDQELGARP